MCSQKALSRVKTIYVNRLLSLNARRRDVLRAHLDRKISANSPFCWNPMTVSSHLLETPLRHFARGDHKQSRWGASNQDLGGTKMRVQNHMTRFFRCATALAALIVISGCASKEVTPDEQLPSEFAGAPEWVLQGCGAYWGDDGGARICGVGNAKIGRSMSIARTKATPPPGSPCGQGPMPS